MSLISILDSRRDLIEPAALLPSPRNTWRTPDGKNWAPQDVLIGWEPAPSDHWACLTLHSWIKSDLVEVQHLEVPQPLKRHSPDDPTWAFIASIGNSPSTSEDLEPDAWIGRADLAVSFDSGPPVLVEFGGCSPAKMVLNIGSGYARDWMIVPYRCEYAFVFRARRESMPLIRRRGL